MAPGGRPKPSRPVRSTRTKIKTYHEDSTSAEDSGLEQATRDNTSQPPSVALRPRTSSGKRRSYREQSSDTNSEGSPDDSDVSVSDTHHSTRPLENPHTSTHSASASTTAPPRDTDPRRPRERDGPPRRSQPKRSTTNPRKSSKRTLGQPLKKRTRIDVSEEVYLSSGVIPPWSSLPYHILFDIFLRASHLLVDKQLMQRTKSTKWLLDMALLCRQFLEPALAALYHSPPLVPASKSFELLWLLSKPQESLSINYAAKVKELHVDAESVLLYKNGPQLGWFDLCDLIATVPRVHTIRLFHKDDSIVGVPAYSLPVSKWLYPERLFSSMDENGIALRSWDWNGRFIADVETLLPLMLEKHQRAAFQKLKHLRLVHVNCSGRTQEEIASLEPCLVAALRQLPRLENLEFIESGIIGQFGLPHLPSNLRSLTLTNCHRVFSPNLEAYLESHGRKLRQLSLSHNRHLKMTFITHLAEYCPNLERFKMDVSMHDWSSYRDTSLHFDELLTSSEVPTWPETLQEIELIQLVKLSEETVEGFFMSLVNAAPRLRDLRRLTITAILKIGWRDRATFRERWIRQLQTTFLRRSAPPDPNLRSLRKRPLHAIQSLADGESARPGSAGSEPSTPSKRQSVRLAQLKDSLSRSPSPAPHEEIQQGMCNYVKIRIDNQRPTETQFNEADFLDDELSGDEDWAGRDWEPPQRHAW